MDSQRIARIRTTFPDEDEPGHGSGYLLGGGFVLTVKHILTQPQVPDPPEPKCIEVFLGGSSETAIPAEVVWKHAERDVMVLRLEHAEDTPLEFRQAYRKGWIECAGEGFPRFARKGGKANPAGLRGKLHRGEHAGEYTLEVASSVPKDHEYWEGVSGTALFARNLPGLPEPLVGVVIARNKALGAGYLRVLPTERFADDPGFREILEQIPKKQSRFGCLRPAVAAAGAVAAGAAGGVLLWGMSSDEQCPPPAELAVLTTADQQEVLQQAAVEYQEHRAAEEDGCLPVRVNVNAEGSAAEARELLAQGWTDLAAGPRPHIFLPDSTADAVLLAEEGGEAAPHLSEVGGEDPLRRSPLILALPESRISDVPACSESESAEEGPDFAECLTAVVDGELQMARAAPDSSMAALLHTHGLYSAVRGEAGEDPTELRIAEARAASAGVDAGDELGLMCALLRNEGGSADVAVLTTEYAVGAYNAGGGLGPGCQDPPLSEEPLVPVHFAGVPDLDYPFLRLDWGEDDGVHEEAERFEEWLRQSAASGAVAEPAAFSGYRTPEGVLLGAGQDDGPVAAGAVPEPQELADVLDRQEQARAPIEVLLAIDRSDSMQGPGTEGTRLETSQGRAADLVGLLGEQDTVGLWAFPEDDADGNDVTGQERILPPEAGMEADRIDQVEEEIAALDADYPATPLADAIRDGAEELDPCLDRPGEAETCVLVVFTDGIAVPEPDGGATDAEVAETLEGLEERVQVHVVSAGGEDCGDELLDRMAEAGAQCHDPGSDEFDLLLFQIIAEARR